MQVSTLNKCIKLLNAFKCKNKKGVVDYHFKNLDEDTKIGIIMIMNKVNKTLENK